MSNIAIILSGGTGTRMGMDVPKQYIEVEGKPIIWYCLKTFIEHPTINSIVIGRDDMWSHYIQKLIQEFNTSKTILYSTPGETRQYSIYNALKVANEDHASDRDIVIIHDAARPLVSSQLITMCINKCKETDAVLPVIAVKDTTYLSKDGKHIAALLDRSTLWSGQAPEAFKFGKYLEAHEKLSHKELLQINGSTELAFKAGLDCRMIMGDPMNFKITTPEDLDHFRTIVSTNNCR